jgi:hypothetical protein
MPATAQNVSRFRIAFAIGTAIRTIWPTDDIGNSGERTFLDFLFPYRRVEQFTFQLALGVLMA